jgi:hypothetical protein
MHFGILLLQFGILPLQFSILPLQLGILPLHLGILPLQFAILPLQFGILPRSLINVSPRTTTKQNLDPRCTYVHAGKNIIAYHFDHECVNRFLVFNWGQLRFLVIWPNYWN